MSDPRIHCIGVLVVDAVSGPIDHYPSPRRDVQVICDYVRFLSGGGAANTTVALAQMGFTTTVFGKVGGDSNGTLLKERLEAFGVDTEGLKVAGGETTPFTFVGVHPDGDRTFIHTPGANVSFNKEDIDLERLLECEVLVYQDLWVLPRLDGPPAASMLKAAQQKGIATVLDECWGLGPERKKLESMLPYVDYFLPSYDDLRVAFGEDDPERILDVLNDLCDCTVVMKMGSQGCLVRLAPEERGGGSGNRPTLAVPSAATRIIDTTGAGDWFDAGFIAATATGKKPVEAAGYGARAAAACIGQIGGSPTIPGLRESMGL